MLFNTAPCTSVPKAKDSGTFKPNNIVEKTQIYSYSSVQRNGS